jgi:hypothetical protein
VLERFASETARECLGRGRFVSIELLDTDECLRLLGSVSVGRVGCSVDALPTVLPVNFVLHDGAIVFRTVPGTKLDAATLGLVVAFEADSGNDSYKGAWSVLVRGVAREVTGLDIHDLSALPLESWAWDGAAQHLVSITPQLITGRRITRET